MIDSIACTQPPNHLKKTCRIFIFIIVVVVAGADDDANAATPAATDIILSIFLQHTHTHTRTNVCERIKKNQHDIFSHHEEHNERHTTVNKHCMQSLFTDKLNKRR